MIYKFQSVSIYFTLVFALTLQNSAQMIKVDSLESKLLEKNWKYALYLPSGYENYNDLDVIYLLHGSNGDETDWKDGMSILDSLIEEELIEPMVAVAPSTGTSWWVDSKLKYESAFFEELKPHIEANFKISSKRESNFIAGFSMGGYGALRYSLTRPEQFGYAILLSPALYNELPPEGSSAIESYSFGKPFNKDIWKEKNYPFLLKTGKIQEYPVELFILSGDDDWNHPEGFEYNIDWQSNLLYSLYNKKLGFPAELRIYNGGHNWELWRIGFREALIHYQKK